MKFRSVLLATIVAALAPSAHAQYLPQGLTCGISYLDNAAIGGICATGCWNSCGPGTFCYSCANRIAYGNFCNGYYTLVTDQYGVAHPNAAPGFSAVYDGDFGNCAGTGYYHQEFGAAGIVGSDGTNFVLPAGAICGFHHTGNSPGHTCMGYNWS